MSEDILEALTIIEEEKNRTKKDIEIIRQAKEEIERLNNIINTIEQYCLDEQIPEEYPDYNDFTEIFNSIYDTIYNKLQELKGSDEDE